MSATLKTLMEARFDRLEQNFTNLRTEWADVYDKVMLLYDRTRKRIKVQEKLSEDDHMSDPVTAIQTRSDVLRAYIRMNGEQ